jgi:oligopeptide transport system substrate-binding protein
VNTFARIYYVSSSIAADLSYVRGIRAFLNSKNLSDLGIRAIDDKTVEFHLERPSGLLLKHLAVVDCAILRLGDFAQPFESKAGIPSSGPYKVIEFSPSQILLEKWRTDRHDSARPPQQLKYFVSDRAPLEAARASDVDTLDFLTIEDKDKADLQKLGWKEQVSAVMWEHFLILNPAKLSAEVRARIQTTIDQEKLADLLPGHFEPAWGLIPSGLPGALTKANWIAIKERLRGAEPRKVAFTLEHTSRQKSLAQNIASTLKSANIDVKLSELKDLNDYLEHLTKKSYEAIIGSRGLDYPDGYSVLSYFRKGYEGNYYHVESPEIDAALDRATMISDLATRTTAYQDLSTRILELGTIAPLVLGNSWSGLWGPRVERVPAHPMGFHQLPLESVEMAP